MSNIGIIGYGNMGEAFAQGVARKEPGTTIYVYDSDANRMNIAKGNGTCRAVATAADVFSSAEIVILAVKPQYIPDLASDVRGVSRSCRLISIAAGVSIDSLKNRFETDSVVRFMPNIAAKTSSALVAISIPDGTDDFFKKRALAIASAIGLPYEIHERLMSAVTGLSGSGIAYVFQFIHSMAMGGTKMGIPYADSARIAIQTIRGAVDLLEKEADHPVSLLSKVTSAAGTTVEGIYKLEENNFSFAVMEAVRAASERAAELEK